MTSRVRVPIISLAIIWSLAGTSVAAEQDPDDRELGANTTEVGVGVEWHESHVERREADPSQGFNNFGPTARSGSSGVAARSAVRDGGYSHQLGCNPDRPTLNPTYRVVVVDNLSCVVLTPPDASPTAPPEAIPAAATPVEAPELIVITRTEAAELLVETGSAEFNDSSVGFQLVNMPVIVWTTAREHVTQTELVGHEVFVRFTPVEFAWDPQDGSAPIVTTDPGAPWPDHTVSHEYARTSPDQQMSLTTTWSAEFMVAGEQAWTPVDGLIEIETQTDPFEIRERLVRLVPEGG